MSDFEHSFDPAASNPCGTTVQLLPREIEDAGLYEVLQTPGAALGSWKVLDALLDPGTSDFVFREPLGHSREVKTALSGLFGRFVARAYLTRYFGYAYFSHITKPPMVLSGITGGSVLRRPGYSGDLPDWITWTPSGGNLAIAEAKGCHDVKGPDDALDRAWNQAQRVQVRINRRPARLKRYAIATRWSFSTSTKPVLAVRDPEEQGNTTPEEEAKVGVGIARLHFASLLRPLGYAALADALVGLARAPLARIESERISEADEALAAVAVRRVASSRVAAAASPRIVGGFVTRGGPIERSSTIDRPDQEVLRKLDLRPAFVGVEIDALRAAIHSDARTLMEVSRSAIEPYLDDKVERPLRSGAGTWIVRLDDDESVVEQE